MAQVLNGKEQAEKINEYIKNKIASVKGKSKPKMAVVQVGNDPASTVYIGGKERSSTKVGIAFNHVKLPEDITQQDLYAEIDKLNKDDTLHGFMVQSPLPRHLNFDETILRINPKKDVDCLHPYSQGLSAERPMPVQNSKNGIVTEIYYPCTPAGVLALLDEYNVSMSGKHCVIVGRSRVVGKPLSLMMLNRDATVTICHSRTMNLNDYCRAADILVVAIGKKEFVTADMIKPGAVIIDVGISRSDDVNSKKIYGDVDYKGCFEKASYITPVLGGVGPMTVAMLMANTLKAWELR